MPGLPGATVDFINNTATNGVDGRAVTANVDDGLGTVLSLAWGAVDAATSDDVLFVEGTYGTCEQTSWESFFGLDSGGFVTYSPSCTDTVSGTTGLDSLFVNDFAVAVEGDPILGLPGKEFRFNSRPGVTGLGEPVWIGGINDTATGAVEGNGLFKGFAQTNLLKTGDMPPGVDFPLDGNAVDFDFRFSPDGSRYITAVDQLSGSPTDDGRVVLDGVGLDVGGAQVEEATVIPASIGGVGGEAWDNFDFFGILDDGTYLITGDTDGDAATDEFVFYDGAMLYREGDTLGDGNVLAGSLEGAYLAPTGDLGLIWDIEDGLGGDVEAVIFNGRVVAAEGDEIDLDGDGSVDAGAVISQFTGISTLTVGTDQRLYATADIDTLGTSSTTDDTEVFLEIDVPSLLDRTSGAPISVVSGGTQTMTLFVPQDVEADIFWVLGSVSGTVPGLPAGAFVLPLNLDAYLLFTLNNPNSGLLSGSFGAPGPFGVSDCTFNVPAGANAGLIGTTVNHAYITLDLSPVLEVTHVSNAVTTTIVP